MCIRDVRRSICKSTIHKAFTRRFQAIKYGVNLNVYCTRGGSRRWSWGGANQVVCGQKSSSGVQGRSLGRGSGNGVPQKLEHFKSIFLNTQPEI